MNKFFYNYKYVWFALVVILFSFSPLHRIPSHASSELVIENLEIEVIDDDVQISWLTSVPASGCVQFGLKADDYDAQLCSTIFERNHVIEISNLNIKTVYHFMVISQSASGDKITSFDATFKTGKYATSEGVVNIENVNVEWVGATAITITWKTDTESTSIVEYGLADGDINRKSGFSGRKVKDHEVTLKGLKKDNHYHFRVLSKDRRGIIAKSGIRRFHTASSDAIDKNDLEIRGLKPLGTNDPAISERSITFTWVTTRPAGASIRYGTSFNKLNKKVSQSSPRLRDHKIVVEGLDPGTTYYFEVSSRDIFGKFVESPGGDGVYALVTKGNKPVVPSKTPSTISRTKHTFNKEAQPTVQSPLEGRGLVLGAFSYIYSPATQLIKIEGSSRVYAVLKPSPDSSSVFKHWLKSPVIFQTYGYRFSDIKTLSQVNFDAIPSIKLAKSHSDSAVYYVDAKRDIKLHIPTADIFNSYSSNKWDDILILNQQDLDSIVTSNLIKLSGNSRVYLIEDGYRRPIMSPDVFNRLVLSWDHIVEINEIHFQSIPEGQQIN